MYNVDTIVTETSNICLACMQAARHTQTGKKKNYYYSSYPCEVSFLKLPALAFTCTLNFCSPEFAGERIPTLKETISLCRELDLVAFIEVKSSTTDIDRVRQLVPIIVTEVPPKIIGPHEAW